MLDPKICKPRNLDQLAQPLTPPSRSSPRLHVRRPPRADISSPSGVRTTTRRHASSIQHPTPPPLPHLPPMEGGEAGVASCLHESGPLLGCFLFPPQMRHQKNILASNPPASLSLFAVEWARGLRVRLHAM